MSSKQLQLKPQFNGTQTKDLKELEQTPHPRTHAASKRKDIDLDDD